MTDTLVLSGGGTRGFYLLGTIQALQDNSILHNVKNYVGTSIGSILCYLLAIGYSSTEILVWICTNKWMEKFQDFNIIDMLNLEGAMPYDKIQEAIEKLSIEKIGKLITLSELKSLYDKNLICVTYNTSINELIYLNYVDYPDLPCITALRMSSNIPICFGKFKFNDNFYIDGGIINNFPILKGIEIGKKVLGIVLEIQEESLKDSSSDTLLSYLLKLLWIPVVHGNKMILEFAKGKCDIISIKTENLGFLEFTIKIKDLFEMFSVGYQQGKSYLSKVM